MADFKINREKCTFKIGDKEITFDEFLHRKTGVCAFEEWKKQDDNSEKTISDFMGYTKGHDGISPINIIIESTNGNFFKKGDHDTELSIVLYQKFNIIPVSDYYKYIFVWKKNKQEILLNDNLECVGVYNGNDIPSGLQIPSEMNGKDSYKIKVGSEDIDNKAVFSIDLYII